MIVTTFIFAVQDGISNHLAGEYNVYMVVMIRYWFFAALVCAIGMRHAGGIRGLARTSQPWLQIGRGLLLAVEILVMVTAFVYLGMVESHAVFACYPLLIAALSGPVLGEKLGWRRWAAIGVGFIGILIILQPGSGVFSLAALIPFVAAGMFALYGLLNRYVARRDGAMTSFFWTGITGGIFMTIVGLPFWQPMTGPDWVWMGCLCLTGVAGHFTLIKAYELAEAGTLQPFAYLQLPFAASIGLIVFHEQLRINVVIGAGLIVAAGLFALWREQQRKRAERRSPPQRS
ncbi:DMT family transporter [Alphaproteobacteria bacterium KMM 3653]|uniref:DMT family transporter n=1 Tax=Harenicola maris TaxID=2841044 RepID=A0AAP2CS79_9RHOB|nr:DMT family transporter [Harenicola maris]